MLKEQRSVSPKGFAFFKDLLEYNPRPHKDSLGNLVVGYNHKVVEGDGVGGIGDIIEQIKAVSLLEDDCFRASQAVNKAVTNNGLTDNQFEALVFFAVTVGIPTFLNSTLLQSVNLGDLDASYKEFLNYTKVHTKQGNYVATTSLITQCEAERDWFRQN